MRRAITFAVTLAACGAPARQTGLVARPGGVGPLDGSAVTVERLRTLFPGYDVAHVPEADDGMTEEHFAVGHGEHGILEISANGETVAIVGAEVDTEMGIHVGDKYAGVTAAIGALACEDGGQYADWTEGLVYCTSAAHPHFSLTFIDADEDGAPRSMASEVLEDRALLAGATLTTITWAKY